MAISEPSSSSPPTSLPELRQELDRLMKARDALELEAQSIREQLLSPGPNGEPPAGLHGTPLVDKEGFPRADIDLYEVRNKRQRLAVIDTDHQQMMKQIEALLLSIHAAARLTLPSDSSASSTSSSALPPPPSRQDLEDAAVAALQSRIEPPPAQPASQLSQPVSQPFALVDQVFRGSPAEESGLRVGDQVLRFGSLDSSNHHNLTALPGLVQNSVGRPIVVMVQRGPSVVSVDLTPHTWSGRGLLGCHLTPLP